MKPLQLILTVAFALFALGMTFWIGKSGGKLAVKSPDAAGAKPIPTELPLPASGPFGKAVAEEKSFDFGTVEKGAQGSHIFMIKNEGEGPLRVKGGKTSCPQCTIGKVSREDDIPPGETVELEIHWNIKQAGGKFRQTADVLTTDPQNPTLVFAIEGNIDNPLHLTPDGTWQLGDIPDKDPVIAEGLLFSTLIDDLVIEKYECSNPGVNVTWEPASAEILAEKEAKSAFKVKVTVSPGIPFGPVREAIKLHTNARGGTDVNFNISGNHPGPLEIKGRGWNAQNNVVAMGEFPATTGYKMKIQMYLRDFDGDLEAQQVNAENSRVQVRVAKESRLFGKSRVYDIEIEVPPGPPAMHRFQDAEPVLLKLNHPAVNEFKLFVQYFAK